MYQPAFVESVACQDSMPFNSIACLRAQMPVHKIHKPNTKQKTKTGKLALTQEEHLKTQRN
jgi:hypothetical protein